MIIEDYINIELTLGNGGENCLGNGEHIDENGKTIEICCENCDFFLCCFPQSEHE